MDRRVFYDFTFSPPKSVSIAGLVARDQYRNNQRGDFEIAGISPELCQRFSKRHEQIERELERLLSEKPQLATGNLKDIKEHLAEARPARKIENIRQEDLQRLWRGQLTESEWTALGLTSNPHGVTEQTKPSAQLDEAVKWAEEHLFDRHSVVLECNLWQEALSRARGQDFSAAELKQFTRERGHIRDPSRPLEVTLREVLLREWEIVQVVREDAGNSHPLVREPSRANPALDEEQRRALERLLVSTNAVTLFRGGAGTGKSFVLREVVEEIRQTARPVAVLAPQRQQVVDMEAAGFPSPTTVTSFLHQRAVPRSAVIVVDEELATVKVVRSDGAVELEDGRVLDASFREFSPGYAMTSYGSQGKTVDYVLFSDSTIKAATNAQQWYVTISRGRRGIRIFTPDKEQLRENVTRSGHRPLALELAPGAAPWRGVRLWDRLHGYLLRFGRRAADNFCRLKFSRRHHLQPAQNHEHKITRMLGQRPAGTRVTH